MSGASIPDSTVAEALKTMQQAITEMSQKFSDVEKAVDTLKTTQVSLGQNINTIQSRVRSLGAGSTVGVRRSMFSTPNSRVRSETNEQTTSNPTIQPDVEEETQLGDEDQLVIRFSKLKLDPYSGLEDPKSYLAAFLIAAGRVELDEADEDAGYCKLFSENLCGQALMWFTQLEPGSINNFDELSAVFLKQYSILMDKSVSDADLWNLTQGPKSLRTFITKFKGVLSKLPRISQQSALSALRKGATYQRLVNKMFHEHLGKTMEVYIDDMLVKSLKKEDHIKHLEECFEILNRYQMKLNPAKCTFGVPSGEFLGYIVTKRGIEANPNQINAFLNMPSPKNFKEVQRLTGRIAALNRFISRSTDKSLPFYQILKGNKGFLWDEKCEEAFGQLKAYLTTPPVLSKPEVDEKLYFPNQSGRLAKWAVELSEYDIEYKSRVSMKAQVLADFLTELPVLGIPEQPENQTWKLIRGANCRTSIGTRVGAEEVVAYCDSQLVVNQFNGDYEAKDLRMEAYLEVVKGLSKDFKKFELIRIPRGENTTADALAALASTSDPELKRIIPVECIAERSIKTDKEALVVTRSRAAARERGEPEVELPPVKRRKSKKHNKEPDVLPETVTESEPVIEDDHPEPDLEPNEHPEPEPRVFHEIDQIPAKDWGADWREPIKHYIMTGELPKNKWQARKMRITSAKFCLSNDTLYKRGVSDPYLLCIFGPEVEIVVREVHEGLCGSHASGRAMAFKIKRMCYYWPTMITDCVKFAQRCKRCQLHAPKIHQPSELFSSISAPYPFMRWSMDIIGPLHRSTRGAQYLLVLTDYFSKWIEAEAYASIKDSAVNTFIWKNIICRHGVPYEIVTDNGPQFISHEFEAFCSDWGIKVSYSTPRYPQGNGQAEAANKTILSNLKKRLSHLKGGWYDELQPVLWAYRTTPRRPTGETPFSLVYGMEAVVPAELNVPGLRRTEAPLNEEENSAMLDDSLDTINERRDQALIRIQNYQQAAARYYNSKVKSRPFFVGDYVLRRVFDNKKEEGAGKLGINWEGPYIVTEVVRNGVYRLKDLKGDPVQRPWNVINLKKFYV
ncbi:Integrase catalytic core [Arabidopsis thaliana x Arabidopsis arenosa]|uniref:Integrase catalytic core n=1 Tax=Arabidopsis thaliana x Arabidopsis arenosa TaxID=1240361 RepID=A0A8T2A5B2_9BRAS|nr:Integrase catalytic core [Arabidopsis thaliana x Arabidopsis arenosa]